MVVGKDKQQNNTTTKPLNQNKMDDVLTVKTGI